MVCARGDLPYSHTEGLSGCVAELALSSHIWKLVSVAALWPVASDVCHAFVPLSCRSSSSWTGNGRLGEPCSYRQLREGTRSKHCHFPFWGTYEPCRFSTREVRMDVYDWQGYINRLQNSSFFSTTKRVICAPTLDLVYRSRGCCLSHSFVAV